jgi:hypothetical protein
MHIPFTHASDPLLQLTCLKVWVALNICFTCKRGSAKHCGKDDHDFPWNHTIFGYLPSRNPSTDHYETLFDLLRR